MPFLIGSFLSRGEIQSFISLLYPSIESTLVFFIRTVIMFSSFPNSTLLYYYARLLLRLISYKIQDCTAMNNLGNNELIARQVTITVLCI